jgi:hypothetical protein
MNTRILNLAAAAAIAIVSLGATAPVKAAPLGASAQALTGQANNLVIEVGHKKFKKFKKWVKFNKHFYPGHYPYWCWDTVLVPTKYGYIEKTVFICH